MSSRSCSRPRPPDLPRLVVNCRANVDRVMHTSRPDGSASPRRRRCGPVPAPVPAAAVASISWSLSLTQARSGEDPSAMAYVVSTEDVERTITAFTRLDQRGDKRR